MSRGDHIGKVYRIGELATVANVSKRTIDYYTNLGLLECEKNSSNYRVYNEKTLQDLQFIEKCKEWNLSLAEIKEKKQVMDMNELNWDDILLQKEDVIMKMHTLQLELEAFYHVLNKLESPTQVNVKSTLHDKSTELMQTLLLFST